LPILFLPESNAEGSVALSTWLRQQQPEVVLSASPVVRRLLRQCGSDVPSSVAYAELLLQDVLGTIAGVQGNHARIGELAVEQLSAQLEQNQYGLPAVPTLTTVGGRWCDGDSLPVRSAIASTLDLPTAELATNLVA